MAYKVTLMIHWLSSGHAINGLQLRGLTAGPALRDPARLRSHPRCGERRCRRFCLCCFGCQCSGCCIIPTELRGGACGGSSIRGGFSNNNNNRTADGLRPCKAAGVCSSVVTQWGHPRSAWGHRGSWLPWLDFTGRRVKDECHPPVSGQWSLWSQPPRWASHAARLARLASGRRLRD